MKWAHLPEKGGIYDQHPRLLDEWRYIFSERNKREAKEAEERKREQEKKERASRSKHRR